MAHKDHGFAYSVHPFAWQLEAMKLASKSRPTTENLKADNSASRRGQDAVSPTASPRASLAILAIMFVVSGVAWVL